MSADNQEIEDRIENLILRVGEKVSYCFFMRIHCLPFYIRFFTFSEHFFFGK